MAARGTRRECCSPGCIIGARSRHATCVDALPFGKRHSSRLAETFVAKAVVVRKRDSPRRYNSAALRAIQKQSSAADRPGTAPEMHLDVAQLCHEYLLSTDEAIRSGGHGSEKGIALRASQERVRALHRHHLLTWAKGQSQLLTHEAQQRARTFDKIETATRALDCLDSALRIYPGEADLVNRELRSKNLLRQ